MSSKNSEERPAEPASVLYVNIVIKDAARAVKNKVAAKVMQNTTLPKPIRGMAAQHVSRVASKHVKPSTVARQMGPKLCHKLPKIMQEKGLTVRMEEAFLIGPYLVLEFQVQHVNAVAVQRSQREDTASPNSVEAASSHVDGTLIELSLRLMGTKNKNKLEEDYLPKKVQEKLEKAMAELMSAKLGDKDIQADVTILREDKQARFFYAKCREVQAANTRKNHVDEFRKKVFPKPRSNSYSDDDF